MMLGRRLALLLLSALITVPLVAAIRKARIALPGEFTAVATSHAVTRTFWSRSKLPVRFGPFAVDDFHRGWEQTRRTSSGVTPPWFPLPQSLNIEAESVSSENSYRFTFYEGEVARWKCACLTTSQSEGMSVKDVPVKGEGSGELLCHFADAADETRVWTLAIGRHASLRKFREHASGELTDGTTTLSIEAIDKYEGSNFTIPAPVGFAVSRESRLIAAVDLTDKGTVYLTRQDEGGMESLLGASLAAILLEN